METRTKGILIGLGALLAVVLVLYGPPPKQAPLGNTLIITSLSAPDTLDTSMSYMSVSWQLMSNIGAGLLTYKKVDGIAGAELVPDLAMKMPEVSNGGKTFKFTMHKGVKFGPPTNREILPSDIKYATLRVIRMESGGTGFYMNIDGAAEYAQEKDKDIRGIVVDDEARTITYNLLAPDATFLYKVALPFTFAIPNGWPMKDTHSTGKFLPAVGPYMLARYSPGRFIEVKRNPNFKVWTPNTPDGFVDGIRIKLGISPDNGVTQIKQGKADYMIDAIPRSKLPMLTKDDKYKKYLHSHETATTMYLFMNTMYPPFNNTKVRQAVNWAIDRRAIAKLAGGSILPTENILPPVMPGYKKHNLYPGPDLKKARALIAESGIKPGKIDLWCRATAGGSQNDTAVYVQGVLNDIGFQATPKCVDSSSYFTMIGNKKTKALIGFGSWGQDFPEASNFIDVLLNGKHINPVSNNNYSWYSRKDTEIDAANALLDQDERNKAWTALDKSLMEDAAWAPYGNNIMVNFTSERMTNFVQSPVYELLYSQVKLKGAKNQPAQPVAAVESPSLISRLILPLDRDNSRSLPPKGSDS